MHQTYEQLDDLYKLQIAARELKHGVKRDDEWRLFEPSKFIYSYFSFNSIYSYDWNRSLGQSKLLMWGKANTNQEDEIINVSESKKIRELVKFISHAFRGNEASLRFASYLKKYLNNTIEESVMQLVHIIPDSNVSQKVIEQFKCSFPLLIEGHLSQSNFKDLLNDVLYFIYMIRNNIFHGSKTIEHMTEKLQRKRLNIYTTIILATNDMLFDAAVIQFNWDKRILDETTRTTRASHISVSSRDSILKNTISKRFHVSIPSGALFYPCCGNDTFEPIILFLDSINEFHFVDHIKLPNLPDLECQQFTNEEMHYSRNRNTRRTSFAIPKDIICDVEEFEPHPISDDLNIIDTLKKLHIKTTGIPDSESRTYRQVWTSKHDTNKTIEIFRHVYDGLRTFLSLKEISVFFYRGDSLGEGGSGQWWLGPDIFNIVLDKLKDGAIIITDGSNCDPDITDVPWKGFWENNHAHESKTLPEDFIYRNRKFKCLGQCGKRYGPVFVWQVNSINKS